MEVQRNGFCVSIWDLWVVFCEFHSLGSWHPEGSSHSDCPLWEPQSCDFSFTWENFFFPSGAPGRWCLFAILWATGGDSRPPHLLFVEEAVLPQVCFEPGPQVCSVWWKLDPTLCVPWGPLSARLSSLSRFHFIASFCLLFSFFLFSLAQNLKHILVIFYPGLLCVWNRRE